MECPQCHKSELATKQTDSAVSIAGVAGVLVFLLGIVLVLITPIIGLLTIITGVVISMSGRSKITSLVCPACRYSTRI